MAKATPISGSEEARPRSRHLAVGIMGSAGTLPPELGGGALDVLIDSLAEAVVTSRMTLFTGETSGIPGKVAEAVQKRGGLTVGVSPAHSKAEHDQRFVAPPQSSDVVVYTGFGYKGRNVVLVRSSDIVLIFGGSAGTLNELTIAYDEGKVIGVLEGTGGVAGLARELFEKLAKPTDALLYFGTDPAELLARCRRAITERRSRTDGRQPGTDSQPQG